MPKEKKNQHFVPRSFLRGFAIDSEDSLIWGYDKKYGKCSDKHSINKICSFDYYYEYINHDGNKTQVLEDEFQKVESTVINIIRNLSISQKISSEDKGRLAFYIGLLITRGPSFRDGIHEYHKHAVEILTQEEYKSGRLPEPPPELKELIVNNDITSVIEAEILPHVSLQFMIDASIKISESLCNKKWDIYFIGDNENFITSDTPIMFESFNPKDNRYIGPAHPESIVLCPITKKILISVRPYCKIDQSRVEFMPVKYGMVNAVNKMMCFYAERFVYASEKSETLLEYVKEAKDLCKKFRSFRFNDTIIPQWDINIKLKE